MIQVFAVSESEQFEILECGNQGMSCSTQIIQLCISAVLKLIFLNITGICALIPYKL